LVEVNKDILTKKVHMNYNKSKEQPKILIDARSLLNSEPLALSTVLSQSWIINFIEMVSVANAIDRLQIITLPEFKDRISDIVNNYLGVNDVLVITDMPNNMESMLFVSVKNMYWRRLFLRAIKQGKTELSSAVFTSINQASDLKIAEDFSGRESAGHGTWVLRYIYRPVGYRIAKVLSHTSISPNMVTLASLMLTLTASIFIALDNYLLGIIAALLLHLFLIFDVVDGILARLKRSNSYFGYWFDTITDTIRDIGLIFSFGIAVVISTNDFLYFIPAGIWIIGHVSTASNHLIEKAAWAKSPTPTLIIKAPRQSSKIKDLIRSTSRLLMNVITGRAETIAIGYTIGLILDAKIIVLLFFSAAMAYRFIVMFVLAYRKYLQEVRGQ